MGKKSTPPPPDYGPIIDASSQIGEESIAVAREQLAWAREQDAANRAILERVLGIQLPIMEEQFRNAQEDRQRYEQVFLPIEDKLIEEFQNYGTPERFDKERGRAIADVNANFDSQRKNALSRLESYGVDPSTTRNQALDVGMRIAQAQTQAGAADAATQRVENTGRALRAEAINIGRGLPSQVAGSYGQAIGAGQAGVGGATGVTNAGVNAYGSALPYYQGALQGYGQAGNFMNQGFQNRYANAQFGQAGMGQWLDVLGTGVGAAIPFMEKGGPVTEQGALPAPPMAGSTDRKLMMATPGEYVVPKHVVQWKGQEFFEKLKNKANEELMAIEIQKRQPQGALPVGT